MSVDYPERFDRVTTAFRLIWVIPVAVVLSALTAQATSTVTVVNTTGQVVAQVNRTGSGVAGGLFAATLLMILFRRRYQRWWFDFALQLNRFSARVGAYLGLLTVRHPAIEDAQSVHLDIDYPDTDRDLNRWLPLMKWFLVIPHLIVLAVLGVGAVLAWSRPGSRSCSPAATRERSSTTWLGSAGGPCASRPTRRCWSPTSTHRSL